MLNFSKINILIIYFLFFFVAIFSFLNFQDEASSGLALGSDDDFKIIVSTEDSSNKIRAQVINSSAGDPESLLSKINELLS